MEEIDNDYVPVSSVPGSGWRVRWPDHPDWRGLVIAWVTYANGETWPHVELEGHAEDVRLVSLGMGDYELVPPSRDE